MRFIVPVFFIVLGLIIKPVLALLKNRAAAKETGLPYILSPVNEHDPSWLLLQKLMSPLLRRLPFGLGSFVKFTERGWNFIYKYRAHRDVGGVFLVVAPSGNVVHIGDPEAAHGVLTKRKEFPKPLKLAKLIDVFGESVISTEGPDWQRHRRITAPPFNERNNALVWAEAMRHAQKMLDHWEVSARKYSAVVTVASDTTRVALDVLMAAGFGMTRDFQMSNLDTTDQGYEMSYREALHTCMSDIFMVFLIPPSIFKLPILPRKLANYKSAVSNLRRHLIQLVSATKIQLGKEGLNCSSGEVQEATLINTLVARAQEQQDEGGAVHKPHIHLSNSNSLTDSEIYGNLFMYSFAGHETMAMTLAYAVYLLAANEEWQLWVTDELDIVLSGHEGIDTLNYQDLFPKLKRCRAVMFEVLRLYPPAVSIPKTTGDVPAAVRVNGNKHIIPPHTPVYANVLALHTDPEYWGDDSLDWKPSRWIASGSGENALPATEHILASEKLLDPPTRGSFIPWADGPRVCPGRKFSEVEFVAAMAVFLWKHRICIRLQSRETAKEAGARVREVIEDSIQHFTLRMRSPGSVGLIFRKR